MLIGDHVVGQNINPHILKQYGTHNWDCINSYSILKNDKYLISGSLRGVISGDSIVDSDNDDNAWIACIDSTGNTIWQSIFFGPGFQSITSNIILDNNDIVCTGLFQDSINCDQYTLIGDSYMSGFICLLDSNANMKWCKKVDTVCNIENILLANKRTNTSLCYIKHDSLDHLILTDDLSLKSINFILDGISLALSTFIALDSTYVVSLNYEGITFCSDSSFKLDTNENIGTLILSIDKDGNVIWEKNIHGIGNLKINSTFPYKTDLCFVGEFDKSILIDSTYLFSNGSKDIFLLNLDNLGTIKFLKNLGGIGNDYGYGIYRDSTEYIVSGSFINSIGFNTTSNNVIQIEATSEFGNSFISRLDIYGNIKSVNYLASNSEDYAKFIDKTNLSIIAIGVFYDTLCFANGIKLEPIGNKDIFLFKYMDCELLPPYIQGGNLICDSLPILLYIEDSMNMSFWDPGNVISHQLEVFTPGEYFVTVISNQGCISIDSTYVSQLTKPIVNVGEDLLINPGEFVNLSARVDEADALIWNTLGTGIFNFQNNIDTYYYPSNLDILSGLTEIVLSASNQCGESSDSLQVIYNNPIDNIIVYPNPASALLNILSINNEIINDITITLSNGTFIQNIENINANAYILSIASYPPGTICLHINTTSGYYTKTINIL